MSRRLTPAQTRALRLIDDRMIAAVWHSDKEYPKLGFKPWYAITGSVLPTQLHTLWLAGLIRLDRSTLRYEIGRDLIVGRVRTTPTGRARLSAESTHQNPSGGA